MGINLREASIADNEGNSPKNQPCVEGAPCAYFSTLPVREMVQAINLAGTTSDTQSVNRDLIAVIITVCAILLTVVASVVIIKSADKKKDNKDH